MTNPIERPINLPIDTYLSEIANSILQNNNVIVTAAPGAGKTTRVPPSLLGQIKGKILVLQPRRIAARSTAARIAEEKKWQLGKEVGYQVRFDNCSSPETRLLILTEALLEKKIVADPKLSDVGCVIFDEFHERNLHSDIGLALCRELQLLERPDLKIIVMSATLDPAPIEKYLSPCLVVDVPGRLFPIETTYDNRPQSLQTDHRFIDRVSDSLLKIAATQPEGRHVLTFLPGQSEIRRIQEKLKSSPIASRLFPLHGNLTLAEQSQVLSYSQKFKIILSTNIAETSLTIDGVDTVVDTGLERRLRLEKDFLFSLLETKRISLSSAEQRRGRAGRQFPGRCFRLWTKTDELSMPESLSPEIFTSELTEVFLTLAALGVSNFENFSWFESPLKYQFEKAISTLNEIGALKNQELTYLGKSLALLPLEPRLGSFFLRMHENNKAFLGALTATIINERDLFGKGPLESWVSIAQDSDLLPRLMEASKIDTFQNASRQLLRKIPRSQERDDGSLRNISTSELDLIHQTLLECYPNRICRRRGPRLLNAQCSSGPGVELAPTSLVRESEFFLALRGFQNENSRQAVIDLAIPLKKSQIINTFATRIQQIETVDFNQEKQEFYKETIKSFRQLVLEKTILGTISKNEFAKHLSEWAQQNPQLIIDKSESLRQWNYRIRWAEAVLGNKIDQAPSDWLTQVITLAAIGEHSIESLTAKDFNPFFEITLGRSLFQIFQKEIPAAVTAPNGKHYKLIYESPPMVTAELKIQEAFGWKSTPRIALNSVPIRLSLLGPHHRPLQTTTDLESFWKGTYQELRPSLKADYPRHYWPEDPTTAELKTYEKRRPNK